MADSHLFKRSSRVRRGWYDAAARKITLQFPDGVRWAYYGVSREVWDGLLQAASAGHYVREVLDRYQNGPAGR